MKLWLSILLLLASCTGTSIQAIGPCTKYSAHDFWSSATAMTCEDRSGKMIGMVAGNGETPAALWASAANAAVLNAMIPISVGLLMPNQIATVSK